jgi:hypothetical protein
VGTKVLIIFDITAEVTLSSFTNAHWEAFCIIYFALWDLFYNQKKGSEMRRGGNTRFIFSKKKNVNFGKHQVVSFCKV